MGTPSSTGELSSSIGNITKESGSLCRTTLISNEQDSSILILMRVKTRKRDFRLTIAEDEAIAQNAAFREMPIATYLRARGLYDEQALRADLQSLRSQIREIHEHLLGQQPVKKYKMNPAAKQKIVFQS